MISKILVAVDGSPHAQAATELAVEIAQHYQASLCLLHALPHIDTLVGNVEYEQLLDTRTLMGQTLLEATRAEIGDKVTTKIQLIEGPPAQALLHVAADEDYDLIVIGARGHGRLTELLGSVSSVVAQQAPCPVLITH